jgi:hypothetical protein
MGEPHSTIVDGQAVPIASVASESDDRVVNNAGNAVRHAYRVLSDEEKKLMVEIKDLGAALLEKLAGIGSSREISIAKTKTEEAVMWAVKHITA